MNRIEHVVDTITAVFADHRPNGETSARRRWRAFQRNADQLGPPPLDTSHKARLCRKIQRIADRHRWQVAIDDFLDKKGVGCLESLTEPQLEDLMGRMEGYLDAAHQGCDMPDDLPAR